MLIFSSKNTKKFVSRGGHKLQGALDHFRQDVAGFRCVDVGSSTGGFSDCLLQAGAASVACVDVNYGQLAWSLRQDPRVSVFERTNIRLASPESLGAPFDMVVCDLSFIGLAQLADVFANLCEEGSIFLGLTNRSLKASTKKPIMALSEAKRFVSVWLMKSPRRCARWDLE